MSLEWPIARTNLVSNAIFNRVILVDVLAIINTRIQSIDRHFVSKSLKINNVKLLFLFLNNQLKNTNPKSTEMTHVLNLQQYYSMYMC